MPVFNFSIHLTRDSILYILHQFLILYSANFDGRNIFSYDSQNSLSTFLKYLERLQAHGEDNETSMKILFEASASIKIYPVKYLHCMVPLFITVL